MEGTWTHAGTIRTHKGSNQKTKQIRLVPRQRIRFEKKIENSQVDVLLLSFRKGKEDLEACLVVIDFGSCEVLSRETGWGSGGGARVRPRSGDIRGLSLLLVLSLLQGFFPGFSGFPTSKTKTSISKFQIKQDYLFYKNLSIYILESLLLPYLSSLSQCYKKSI